MKWREVVSGNADSKTWDIPNYSSWSEQAPVGCVGQKLLALEFSIAMAQEPIFGHSKQIVVSSPARCLKLIHLMLEICSAILNIQGNEGKI